MLWTFVSFQTLICCLLLFQSFLMRKEFFNNETNGFFKTQTREPVMKNPMTGRLFCPLTQLLSLIGHSPSHSSLTHMVTHPLARSLTQSLTVTLAHSLSLSLDHLTIVYLLAHSHSPTRSNTHLPICSLIHLLARSFTHSFTHQTNCCTWI